MLSNQLQLDYDTAKKVVDLPNFRLDWSMWLKPEMPDNLRFWLSLEEHEKELALKRNPKLWLEGSGAEYLVQLTNVISHNDKCRYWLPVFRKACEHFSDDKRLGLVLECMETYG